MEALAQAPRRIAALARGGLVGKLLDQGLIFAQGLPAMATGGLMGAMELAQTALAVPAWIAASIPAPTASAAAAPSAAQLPAPEENRELKLSLILVDSRNAQATRQFLESSEGRTMVVEIARDRRIEIGIPT
jgi:L-alanine-DL-glutamate epimerase-like enolase superfamily enzyme